MKVHYPKLYNMAHFFYLNVFTASKGSNNYILFITKVGLKGLGSQSFKNHHNDIAV